MAYPHLTIFEVCCIEFLTYRLISIRAIAKRLRRSPETIDRVVRFIHQGYNAVEYMERYLLNKKKCGRKKIILDPAAEALMWEKLQKG